MKVYKRSGSKHYYVTFEVGGVRQRKSTGESDEVAANAKAWQMLLEEQTQQAEAPEPSGGLTLAALHASWAATLGQSEAARQKSTRAKRFVAWADAARQASAVTAAQVGRFVTMLEQEGKARETVKTYRSSVSRMYAWARQEGLVPENPVVGSKTAGGAAPQKRPALSPAEAREVLDAVAEHPQLAMAYHLAFFAGLRIGEIARARWEHVSPDLATILVAGSKTDGSTATLPIHGQLRQHLGPLQRSSGPLVAHHGDLHYHPQALTALRRRFAVRELPGFHAARRTLGTILAQSGVSIYKVSQLLRHSSVKTTERYYAWASPKKLNAELNSVTF